MKCTRQEFEAKVRNKHPARWINIDVCHLGKETSFILDTAGECQYSFSEKQRLASYIWYDGAVIKDSDGLFSPPAPLPGGSYFTTYVPTVTISSSTPNGGTYTRVDGPVTVTFGGTPVKCECGANSVGSNSHSSWCGIKEGM
jgi:hypothetical protein